MAKDSCDKLLWRQFYVDNIIVKAGENANLEVDGFTTFLNNANKSQIRSFNKALKSMRKAKNYKPYQAQRAFDKIYDLVYGADFGRSQGWIKNLRAKGLIDEVKPDSERLVTDFISKRILKKNIVEVLDELGTFSEKPIFRKKFLKYYHKFRSKLVTALDTSMETGFLLYDGAFPFIPRIKMLEWKKLDPKFMKEIEELIAKEGIDAAKPRLIEKLGKTAQVDIVYSRVRRVYNSYAIPLLIGSVGYSSYEMVNNILVARKIEQDQAEEMVDSILEMETHLMEESDAEFFSLMTDLGNTLGETVDIYEQDFLKMRVVQATIYIHGYFCHNLESEKLLTKKEYFTKSSSKEEEARELTDKMISLYENDLKLDPIEM